VKGKLAPRGQAWDGSVMPAVDLVRRDHCLPAMMPPSTGRMTPVMKLA
jgi:hypothetical protein